ncbi:signal peptidase I [Fictibacillus nanhaiensis]|uniref:signal peptidase I SipW n=1 Tax=Fictibacillus nanhaiensis TaxID=742169 RepID=UPI001C95C38A|nr:signal peptidase I [Fictibacillus nanhaiensis]MBY6037208.1 signal peptidase I [Fictibacillus nanhaiensis]
MKLLKWLNQLTTVFLTIILFALLVFVISSKLSGGEPQIMGYQIKSVHSGSMEPDIQTGSIIAIKPGGDMTRFKSGDVIIFKETDKLITHRVLEVKGKGNATQYITKGDSNDGPDIEPVLPENVVGEYNGFTIPYIGYLLISAQSKIGTALLLILPGLLLLVYSAMTIWNGIKEVDLKKEAPTTEK